MLPAQAVRLAKALPGIGLSVTGSSWGWQERFRIHQETWKAFHDNTASPLDIGARQGDLRAAMAPFLANQTFGACPSFPVKASD